jgi:hypothetical protein
MDQVVRWDDSLTRSVDVFVKKARLQCHVDVFAERVRLAAKAFSKVELFFNQVVDRTVSFKAITTMCQN